MQPHPGEYFQSLVLPSPRAYQRPRENPQQRVQQLLHALGDPHTSLRCLHIAGSKGKGSVALYSEAVLHACEIKVGTFTSPHLQRWTERFRLFARESTDAELDAALTKLRPVVADLQKHHPQDPPTFFDVMTACAFIMFAQAEVEVAIIEAGIGARLDATLVAPTTVACLTSIELEHTDKLGHDLRAIAEHKVAVIRHRRPVVCGRMPASIESLITGVAKAKSAPLFRLGKEVDVELHAHDEGATFRSAETKLELKPRPKLQHVADNMAMAVQCAMLMNTVSAGKLQKLIHTSLDSLMLPGRCECLRSQPYIIADGAHTPAAGRVLAEYLAGLCFTRLFLVVSATTGKHIASTLHPLLGQAHFVVATCVEPTRSMSALALHKALMEYDPELNVEAIPDAHLAVSETTSMLNKDDALVVTGSVYIAGLARTLLGKA